MNTRRTWMAAGLMAALFAFTHLAVAGTLSYIVAYGDSLSDNGNLYGAVGYPPAPYWQGRASNGPVAVEYLSKATGLTLFDFAWFGATTGVGNDVDGGNQTTLGSFGLPGMQTQLALTKSSVAPIAGNTLFVVWGGPNDFLTNGFTAATAQTAVSDLVGMVIQLQGLGAKHIVVPGMPDIGLTPDFLGNTGATQLSYYFNQLLLAELPKGTVYIDTFGLMHQIVANPSAYGFTDVTDPCFNGATVCSNANQYLFWDGFHPTTRGHELLAGAIENAAVPELSSLMLLGSGMVGVAGLLRRRALALLLVTFCAGMAMASTTNVNCSTGQSLNSAISTLNKQGPNTVLVQGTCTEYVSIVGFENLTIKGNPSATIDQPNSIPTKLFLNVLRIDASRSVTLQGLSFNATQSVDSAIAIGAGSNDVRLRNLSVVGGQAGIVVFEHSQASLAAVSVQNAGYGSLAIWDSSDVHVEDCLFEDLTGTTWHSGIILGASHVTIRRTNIHNMQVGILASASSIVDTGDFNTYYPRGLFTDVVIDNPSGGINYNGVQIDAGSSLNVGSAKLRILNAGQSYGGSSGGILVSGGSSVHGNSNLIISGSYGQGIYATGNSHVTLDGSSITGSQHGGLVAVNLSTISTVTWDQPVTVSGNAVDVFCDSNSMITGGVKIANASTVQCQNLLAWDSVPVP